MADKKEKELLRLYDKDGQFKTLAVPSDLNCTDVIGLYGKKIVGFHASQFRLCVEYKGAKTFIVQTAFPYHLAKELESDAPNDEGRMKGVSKVKFYLVDAPSAETLLPKYEPAHVQRKGSEPNGHAKTAAPTPRKLSNATTPRKPSDPPARKNSDSEIAPKRSSGDGSLSARKNSTGDATVLARKNSDGVTPRKISGGDGSLSARKNSVGDGSLSARKNSTDANTTARKNSGGDASTARKNSSGNLKKSDDSVAPGTNSNRKSQIVSVSLDNTAGTRRSVIGKALPKTPSTPAAATAPNSSTTSANHSATGAKALPPTPSANANQIPTTSTTSSTSTPVEVSKPEDTPTLATTTTPSPTSSTSDATTPTSTSPPSSITPTTTPTGTTTGAPELVELSAYLLKKDTEAVDLSLEPVWAYFRPGQGVNEPVLALFETHESNDPLHTIYLADAKYDLQLTEECPFPFFTVSLPNGKHYVFTAETITEWHESLQQATKVWVPPPPALAPQQSAVRRSATQAPMPVVSMEQILMKKSALRASMIATPSGESLPQDHAIISWVNFCCSKSLLTSPATICQDMRDGLALARLVEVLFDKQVTTKMPNSVFDFNHNASVSLDTLRQLGAPTNSLAASDLVDCKQPRVLFTLLWNLFFFFVNGTEESAAKEKLSEWSKTFVPDVTVSKIQDGTVFAAILHKNNTDALDFDVAVQQQQAVRLENVLSVAEKQLKVPKLFKESSLTDERVSAMYLSLLYLSIGQSDKWTSFLQRVNSSAPSALDPVNSPMLARPKSTSDAARPALIQPKLKSATSPNAVASSPPNSTPVVTATLRTTPRKLSNSKVVKAEQTKESTQALLANIKLKHVATKTGASKPASSPSAPIIPQLKKTAKIAPLLVAEGYKGVSAAKPVAKTAAKPTAAKPAAAKLGAKPGAKLAAKPAASKVAAKPAASVEHAVATAPPQLPFKPEGLTLPDAIPPVPTTTSEAPTEEATDSNIVVKEVVATEHSDPAETTDVTDTTDSTDTSHADTVREVLELAKAVAEPTESEPERSEPEHSEQDHSETEQSESERTEPENVECEQKEPVKAEVVHQPQPELEKKALDAHKEPEPELAAPEVSEPAYKEPEHNEPEESEPKAEEPEHKEPEVPQLLDSTAEHKIVEVKAEEPEPTPAPAVSELKPEEAAPKAEELEPKTSEVLAPKPEEPERRGSEAKEPEPSKVPNEAEQPTEQKSEAIPQEDAATVLPAEAPAGDVVLDPLPSTEAKKEVTEEAVSTVVYDTTTATVASPEQIAEATPAVQESDTAADTTTTQQVDNSLPATSGVAVYDATTGTVSDDKALADPSTTTSATEFSERPEADDEGDEDDVDDYDDSDDYDSGADAPNVQVKFEKNRHSHGSRFEAMRQWRQSSVAPPSEKPDTLGPILTREEAVKEGLLDDSESTPTSTTTSRTTKRQSEEGVKRTVGFFVSESDNNSTDSDESEEDRSQKSTGEDLFRGNVSNNNNETPSVKSGEEGGENQEAKDEKSDEKDNEQEVTEEKPEEGAADTAKEAKVDENDEHNTTTGKSEENTTSEQQPAVIVTDTENITKEGDAVEQPKEEKPKRKSKPPKVVIRVTLEGFGEAQFRSFSIDPKTLAGDVVLMMAEKMKFTEIEVPEYGLFVVKNGLERLLDSDEEVMTAEVNVEKFVYKRNYENEGDRDRKLFLSIHRSQPFKYHKNKK